jgi:hypothetical protein
VSNRQRKAEKQATREAVAEMVRELMEIEAIDEKTACEVAGVDFKFYTECIRC